MTSQTKLSRKKSFTSQLHHLTTSEYIRILLLRTVGNFLLLSSIFVIARTFFPVVREEARYFFNRQILNKKYEVHSVIKLETPKTVKKGLLSQVFNLDPVEILIPVDPDFSIVIPKIAANAHVLPNVNPAEERVYLEALNRGVAHAAGTAFPGESGHIFLFAHSTNYFWNVSVYNAIFYLLYKLERDDEVNIFYKGQRYVYRVIGKEVVDPSEVQYLTRKTNREFLTLQTCWPPGTTFKRLLVFAVRVIE
ncbi:MAG: sortase [Patescibacteria group bacterium]|nr:sortase [Patescibacteria group bacterium]